MAFGLSAPGRSPEHYSNEASFRTLAEYRQIIRELIEQGAVDIMLMSASTNELLAIQERLFSNSHITSAVTQQTYGWQAVRATRGKLHRSRSVRKIDHIML